MEKAKLVLVTVGSYPFGTADTIRYTTLAKGIAASGLDTSIFLIYPDKNQDERSNKLSGNINGVHFEYMGEKIRYETNSVLRLLKILYNTWKCTRILRNRYSRNQLVVFNLFGNPFISLWFTILMRNRMALYIHEVTEFPFLRNKGKAFPLMIYKSLLIRLFDRIYVISTALKDYFNTYVSSERVEILNMIVDHERFNCTDTIRYDFDYIAYCGSMNTDKDGVPILIQAFSIVKKRFPHLKLLLIGDHKSRPVEPSIMRQIEENKLQESIVFTGHINSSDIPKYLVGAKVLALARPDNIQAKGGFPTKLGEYLATGKPVVVTNVGDIPKFIEDGVNGFLSNPEPNQFAMKLIEVLNDYKRALHIGEKGKILAKEQFNYFTEATKISNYIKDFSEY